MTEEDCKLIERIDAASGISAKCVETMVAITKTLVEELSPEDVCAVEVALRATETDVRRVITSTYAVHHSTEDLRVLAEWYESPIGRRVTAAAPVIQDAIKVGLAPILERALGPLRAKFAKFG